MRFANDFHSWLRHSWKLLANRLTRDPIIVIHGNSCIILYFFDSSTLIMEYIITHHCSNYWCIFKRSLTTWCGNCLWECGKFNRKNNLFLGSEAISICSSQVSFNAKYQVKKCHIHTSAAIQALKVNIILWNIFKFCTFHTSMWYHVALCIVIIQSTVFPCMENYLPKQD